MTILYDMDPAVLSSDQQLSAVVDAEREIARLHARQVRLIQALVDEPRAGSPAPELDRHFVREELRAALGESAIRVNGRVELAEQLTDRLPGTLAALEAGTITLRHAGSWPTRSSSCPISRRARSRQQC